MKQICKQIHIYSTYISRIYCSKKNVSRLLRERHGGTFRKPERLTLYKVKEERNKAILVEHQGLKLGNKYILIKLIAFSWPLLNSVFSLNSDYLKKQTIIHFAKGVPWVTSQEISVTFISMIKGKHAKHAKAMTLLLEQAKICHGLKRCLIVSLQRNRFVTGYFSTKRSRFALNQKSFPYKLICLFSYISRYGNSIEMKASETYHN